MAGHPVSPAELDRFSSGAASATERRRIVRHLLTGCAICRHYLLRIWDGSKPVRGNVVRLFRPDYDAIFEQLGRRIEDRLRESSTAAQALASLQSQSPARQELLVRNHPRFKDPELCELLIARSHESRFSEAGEMVRQARLALALAQGLHTGRGGRTARRARTYRSRAWSALGNALRVSGDLNAANEALQAACANLEDGDDQLPFRAHLLGQIASLRFDQRQFVEAIHFNRKATEISRELSDHQEVVYGLVKEAMVTGEAGEPAQAVRLLERAEEALDSRFDPRARLFVSHNLVFFQLALGRVTLARRLFDETLRMYTLADGHLIQVKALWLEGSLSRQEGDLRRALRLLRGARELSRIHGSAYEAALLDLEVSSILFELRRFAEMRPLALSAFRELRARRVAREALAALILLRQAA